MMKQLAALLLLFPFDVFAQTTAYDSLDAFIRKEAGAFHIPGLAVGIIKNNQIVFTKGYGLTSTINGQPVTGHTIFPLASCTKAFTAAAMGILADEGKLQWNDKVITYLPEFALSDSWITRELTISDILSHRSGLESFEGDLLWYGSNYSRNEIVKRIRHSPIRNQFRVEFGYQNVMYLVAGLIIEKVSGMPWERFIKERILTPLHMQQSTGSSVSLPASGNYASAHLKNKPVAPLNLDNIAPAGGINASVEDVCKWVQLWTGKGRVADKVILNESSYEAITGFKTILPGTADRGYGYGWYISYKNGKKVLNHDGAIPGIMCSISVTPEDSTGIIILANKISYLNSQLITHLYEYLEAGTLDWQHADSTLYGKNRQFYWDQERDTTKLNSTIPGAMQYTGIYTDKAYGNAKISCIGNYLILQFIPSKGPFTGRLYYNSANKCTVVFNDAFIPAGEVLFERNSKHQVEGFTMNIATNDFHFEHLHFIKQ